MALVVQGRELLDRDLLLVENYSSSGSGTIADIPGSLPTIPWGSIVDSPAVTAPGYSFVTELVGSMPATKSWLSRRILNTPALES